MSAQMIQYPSNGDQTPGYLAVPSGPGPFPAVVAIQEWWGLVGHIKSVADRLAAEGYAVLAPDLYHGQAASEPDEARKLAMALNRAQAIQEIHAAGAYLNSLEYTTGKVGLVGWCMGGGLALSTAAAHPVDAVVCFYGRPLEAGEAARIRTPVLGLYGENDGGIPASIVNDFEKQLSAQGTPHAIHIYAGADHAFFNEDRPEVYHPAAAAEAWKQTLAWFEQYLGG
ncbi:MAG: dienelactone hydrolase family protein [Anaerolineales bacterium]|nr:dienelactone hydrolase family protein [Anaerolineales bacterium]MCW5854979.1 dienelactone hydrolase family protein [Anaerolineales bacterium]